MRKISIAIAAIAWVGLVDGCSRPTAPAAPLTQVVDGMTVTLTSNPTPPHTGDDTLTVMLTDAVTQQSIGNANITATATMLSPRMPGSNVSGRAQGNGRYDIPVRLAIASRYEIGLHIERTGKPPASVSFSLEAEQ